MSTVAKMDKNINIGLIGYKFMGKAHSNAYKQVGVFFNADAHVNMKAICGREEEWVAKSAKKYGWDGYETSWQRMIERNDIDAIDITTPSNVHKEIAIAAANAGKAIFCEKPLALNLKDAREMQEAAIKNKVKNQVGFNYRFAPAVKLAKKLIDEGKIGQIYHFRGNYLQDWIIDPEFPLVWRLDKKVCGSGSLGDLGAHVIDLARYLVGDVDRVSGVQKTFITERPLVERMEGLSGKAVQNAPRGKVEVDDATTFIFEFKCGALGVIEASRFAYPYKNALFFEINGSKGSLRFEFERMNELKYYSTEDAEGTGGYRLIQVSESIHPYMEAWWPAGHVIGYEHTFVHEMYEFIQSIANETPNTPDFGDGVKCSQIIEAVEISAANRQWVNVDDL